jgi:hypothetical protein
MQAAKEIGKGATDADVARRVGRIDPSDVGIIRERARKREAYKRKKAQAAPENAHRRIRGQYE